MLDILHHSFYHYFKTIYNYFKQFSISHGHVTNCLSKLTELQNLVRIQSLAMTFKHIVSNRACYTVYTPLLNLNHLQGDKNVDLIKQWLLKLYTFDTSN